MHYDSVSAQVTPSSDCAERCADLDDKDGGGPIDDRHGGSHTAQYDSLRGDMDADPSRRRELGDLGRQEQCVTRPRPGHMFV